MPTKPFQSKLNPYRDDIIALRDTNPPTGYHRIAEILKEKYGMDVSHHAVWHFVKVRSKPRKGYRIAAEPASARIKSKISDHAVTPQQTKPKTQWNLLD